MQWGKYKEVESYSNPWMVDTLLGKISNSEGHIINFCKSSLSLHWFYGSDTMAQHSLNTKNEQSTMRLTDLEWNIRTYLYFLAYRWKGKHLFKIANGKCKMSDSNNKFDENSELFETPNGIQNGVIRILLPETTKRKNV